MSNNIINYFINEDLYNIKKNNKFDTIKNTSTKSKNNKSNNNKSNNNKSIFEHHFNFIDVNSVNNNFIEHPLNTNTNNTKKNFIYR